MTVNYTLNAIILFLTCLAQDDENERGFKLEKLSKFGHSNDY